MKILFHYNDYAINPERKKNNQYGGVGYYRVIKVAEQVKGHEVKVVGTDINQYGDDMKENMTNVFKEFDVLWMPYFYNPASAGVIFYMKELTGKKVIIDLDDNFWDVPESNYLYEQFRKTKKDRAYLSTILSLADAVTVSTEPLRDKVKQHIKEVHGIDKPVFVIPNCNDINDWNYPMIPRDDEKIVIGYSGSTSHNDDFRLVLPALVKIMKKYPNVWFEALGILTKDNQADFTRGIPQDVLRRMGGIGATHYFRQYPEMLPKRKWNIGIAPLVDTAFTRCKSHIKWMEYSMYKIPTVASRVYPYFMDLNGKQTIEDGVTGMLCRNHEWFDKLEKLVLNENLRKQIGENAYNHIKKEWQYKDSGIDKVVAKMLK